MQCNSCGLGVWMDQWFDRNTGTYKSSWFHLDKKPTEHEVLPKGRRND